ncbi:cell wall protein [Ophiocordyceps camponoti-floridani]|uniref:Cell wall protein n=1 Tax=Ophiocordyceps camponoti-floridani TaxID=2030778 RepID=A0A8H4VDW0_9HYPO|nr:cell wall protein [Ophiocordyceps camponoti-floridani]
MKCNVVVLTCLATSAMASIEDIKQAIGNCGKGIEALGSALKSYSGNVQPVKDAADSLIATLKESEGKAAASEKLDLSGALGLQEPVQALQASGKQLVSDLKTRKPMIEKSGNCKLVREEINAINAGSLALMKAIVEKVPEDAQPIAQKLAAPLKKSLEEAASEFSEQNCKDSGSPAKKSSEPAVSSEPATSSAMASSSAPAYSSPASASSEHSAPASSAYTVPAGASTTPYQPTGTGHPTGAPSSQPPMVTAGAALVAPAGVLAMAAAALIL